jgi:hypothetical protein
MDNRNLITALVIAALITLAATAAGCTTNTSPSPTPIPSSQTTNGNNTTFSSGTGFNITYPTALTGVTNVSNDPAVTVKIYVPLNSSSVVDAVNVGTIDLSAGQTLSSFVDSQMVNVTKYPNYQEISNNTTTVSGQPAQTIVYQGLVPVQHNTTPASTTNMTLKVMQTFVVNNNTGYVITYKAVPSDYNTYLAQAQRIMSSFVLT